MPPPVALAATLALVLWLVIQDVRGTRGTTAALWIPLCWFLIICSRFVSIWLDLGISMQSPTALEEGSTVDAGVFGFLMLAALTVLVRRSIPWRRLAVANFGVFVYLLFAAISIAWSDFPFVAFKRWVKVLGHPLMVLVVLSEPNPTEALRALIKRTAYILIPLSIVLIRYFPELGRGFDLWTGQPFNTGVTTNKNALGVLCLISAFFFIWNLFVKRPELPGETRTRDVYLGGLLLVLTLWLLNLASSATSLGALMLGVVTLTILRFRRLREGRLGLAVMSAALLLVILNATFDLWSTAITALGREATLTDRTELWSDALALQMNPLLGAGFESFWLGERAAILWAKWPWRPNQAHNGYLETYLAGGWLGVACLALLLASSYRKAKASLNAGLPEGQFRMGLLAIILAYNYTEAGFKAMHPMFFIAFLISLDLPKGLVKRLSGPRGTGVQLTTSARSTDPVRAMSDPALLADRRSRWTRERAKRNAGPLRAERGPRRFLREQALPDDSK